VSLFDFPDKEALWVMLKITVKLQACLAEVPRLIGIRYEFILVRIARGGDADLLLPWI
jgi:hypothetical protein